ncbi:TadE/TadG family type IV pilus assembly protein [Sneathiella chinensis]|uniref:TadE-like domain-containing protein n=1 Tax=Sneathiella chinensis TaxID=349750 RepID=A0ABQ5U5T1_9PROT|nr:TadE/TadG family type IV pilus assembly protein [Sneathiella chinensis]GLQ06672.1 hypothetical protein GCM10007924_18930 [Sneathiella chinensis]
MFLPEAFARSEGGSVFVETALLMPVLVFLLVLGFDLVRLVQLDHEAEEMLTQGLVHLSEADYPDQETVQSLHGRFQAQLHEDIKAVGLGLSAHILHLPGEGGEGLPLSLSGRLVGRDCPQAGRAWLKGGSQSEPAPFETGQINAPVLPDQYLAVLTLCLYPADAFFLTGFFEASAEGMTVSGARPLSYRQVPPE